MSIIVPNKLKFVGAFDLLFNLKKSAAEAHRLLVEAYCEVALSERSCEWLQKFRNCDFDVDDKVHSGIPKSYKDIELQALLEEDRRRKNASITTPDIVKLFAIQTYLYT